MYSPLLLPAIEQWRSTLTLTERLKLNHPATVMKRKRTCSPQGGRQSLTGADLRNGTYRFAETLSERSNSAEGDHFKASHPECTRCAGRQVYAASLYEWTAVIDSDSDASSA